MIENEDAIDAILIVFPLRLTMCAVAYVISNEEINSIGDFVRYL